MFQVRILVAQHKKAEIVQAISAFLCWASMGDNFRAQVRLQQLFQITIGWCSYYKLADCKSFLLSLDEWIRFSIRMCFREAWKISKKLQVSPCLINRHVPRACVVA
ncbi:group II intron maturase-specific domain-containing protein [Bacteroides ihuae]|uniref:group II intron maturase-specific domain-containing protein n=1 Tax=Bacteroides ihuae TaxID=1852362 RepID=UPI00098F6AE9